MSGDLNLEDDIIDLKTMRRNLSQIVDEVRSDHTHKVIIKNNKPAAILVNVADYQALQNRLLAMELEMGLREMIEEDSRGELVDLDDLAAEFGIDLSKAPTQPKNYEEVELERSNRAF